MHSNLSLRLTTAALVAAAAGVGAAQSKQLDADTLGAAGATFGGAITDACPEGYTRRVVGAEGAAGQAVEPVLPKAKPKAPAKMANIDDARRIEPDLANCVPTKAPETVVH
jgi:hypothetical protein